MSPPPSLSLLPRLPLIGFIPPLQHLPRFSQEVGAEVWIKRDDVGSPALAGNKARKLELLLGEARRQGADTLITTGAAQSNSARAAAAAARVAGMRAVLVLGGNEPDEATGNLVVDRLVGAELRFQGPIGWEELDARVEETAHEVRASGGRPFTAPTGCSSPLGSLGFALAYFELLEQLEQHRLDPSRLYHAPTSGGTHAGLALGRALAGHGPPPRAISAGRIQSDPVAHHRQLARAAAALISEDVEPVVEVDFGHIGEGYGVPTEEGREAIRLLARTEGILCDPVYSGKGLAGLVADVADGKVQGPVVFWHTGGWQALFHPPLTAAVL